jgi:uncharacterized membrane protein YidH (DUF202 family)
MKIFNRLVNTTIMFTMFTVVMFAIAYVIGWASTIESVNHTHEVRFTFGIFIMIVGVVLEWIVTCISLFWNSTGEKDVH